MMVMQYNPIDAGYPASDEAMRQIMQKPQCAWMSITNGDNAYGSAVVRTVLEAATAVTPVPNLVMLPMSSRNFDNLGRLDVLVCAGVVRLLPCVLQHKCTLI